LLLGLDVNKLALTNPTGEKEFVEINWGALFAKGDEVDVIEERIKQAGVVDAAPNQSVSPGGQTFVPKNLSPSKNGDCHG